MQLVMPRKAVTYRFDDRLIAALKEKAQQSNNSVTNWLETHLIEVMKTEGFLPQDFQPLGETRGGDRSKNADNADQEHN